MGDPIGQAKRGYSYRGKIAKRSPAGAVRYLEMMFSTTSLWTDRAWTQAEQNSEGQ